METTTAITVRLAGGDDAAALRGLARLDSARPLAAPVLVAESGGELRAALSLADGAAVADPFRPTLHLVELLRLHAAQLSTPRRRHSAARALRLPRAPARARA